MHLFGKLVKFLKREIINNNLIIRLHYVFEIDWRCKLWYYFLPYSLIVFFFFLMPCPQFICIRTQSFPNVCTVLKTQFLAFSRQENHLENIFEGRRWEHCELSFSVLFAVVHCLCVPAACLLGTDFVK